MIKLSQSEYINSILQQFDMTECNPVVTPADKGAHLQNDESVPFDDEKKCQALTGSLTYGHHVNTTGHWVHHPILVPVKQKPMLHDWNMEKIGTEIPQGFKKHQ